MSHCCIDCDDDDEDEDEDEDEDKSDDDDDVKCDDKSIYVLLQ